MSVKIFKLTAEKLIFQLEGLINEMPDKGLKEEESQKICLLNALRNFYYTVNGTEAEDFN
jgi:hypothetical protein